MVKMVELLKCFLIALVVASGLVAATVGFIFLVVKFGPLVILFAIVVAGLTVSIYLDRNG